MKWTHDIGSSGTRDGRISIVLATRHNWQRGLPRPWLRWEDLGGGIRISTMTLVDWSARIVRGLLELSAGDWRLWASLTPHLPLLAEAAPRQFLDAIERGLGEDGPILELLKQEGDAVFGTAPHTGVLWALEGLAWSVDHLPRVAVVLTDLARLDPGGRLANRPRESLRRIFLIWYPQNTLSWNDQLGVFEFLMSRDSQAGWSMLSGLLPRTDGQFACRCTSQGFVLGPPLRIRS